MLATFKSMNFIKNSEISLLAFAFFLNLPHLMRSSFFFLIFFSTYCSVDDEFLSFSH